MTRRQAGEGVAVFAAARSQNEKVGPVSTTTASILGSCGECPLKEAGCYARQGPLGWQVARMDRHVKANNLDEIAIAQAEASAIDKLDRRAPLRLHVAGDCRTDEAAKIVSEAAERHAAWTGYPSWSYTHSHRDVARESWGSVSVLASCETPDEALTASQRGYASALVVERFESDRAWTLPTGQKAVPCPEQTGRAMSCMDCRLCWNDKKLLATNTVICFEVHGSQAKKVSKMLRVLNG